MTLPPKKAGGLVCLVGAGPGDPGLITVRGLERLKRADVVVYDALADPALLAHAPAGAELIDVGKRGGYHKVAQDQIHALLLEKARAGHFVVRLKGGDPYLFGRGAEEVAFLARHGIACEVVPGVTAGIAAPATAGIPVTHRRLASSVTFVTGHEDPAKQQSALDYRSLAGLVAAGGTLCFFMAASRLAGIAQRLQAHGLAADAPAAVVQWGATPRQRSMRAPLSQIAQRAAAAGLGAPAILVVGAVASLEEPGLDFFTARPLFGQSVLLTRTRQQVSDLHQQLAELGARVFEAPTIEIAPPSPQIDAQLNAALRGLPQFDWLVLTSANGVAALAERLGKLQLDSRHLGRIKIAAIGAATATALWEQLRIHPDLVPEDFVAEALAAELTAGHAAAGQHFLLLRADIARTTLPELLVKAGAVVTDLAVYQTRPVQALPPQALEALRHGQIHWVAFTSGSTVRNLVALLGSERGLLDKLKLASIGPVTSQALREMGLTPAVEAVESTVSGLVAAIVAASHA